MTLLLSLIEFLHQEARWDSYFTEHNLVGVKRMLASVINIYEKQIEHKTLTKNQAKMLKIFTNLDKILRETNLRNLKDGKIFPCSLSTYPSLESSTRLS